MNKHRITSDERAVSGLVGEVLLIGIVIVAIGLIAVSVYSYLNKDPDTPHIEVDGVANMMANEIHIKHQGGDSIEGGNLRVLVSVNGTTLPAFDEGTSDRWGIRIKGENDVEKNFDRWTLGDILVLATHTDTPPQINLTDDDEIRVTIVSLSSSRVIVSGEVFGGVFGDASINTAPIADAGDDQTDGLCENTTWAEVWVWFNGSGSYDPDNPYDNTGDNYRGIVSWDWDFGEGNKSEGLWVWHNYSVNGTYYVTLTVTDVDGATDTDTCIVTINPPANLTADAGPDQWVGIGAEVQFNGSGSTGCINEWQWEFGDGTNAPVNASTTTHTYSDEGNYTVNLTVVEDHTGKTSNDTATVHVMSGFKIVYPYDGGWVSGLVTIDARAFDTEVDYVNFNISSVSNEDSYSQNATDDSSEVVALNTTGYTYGWNTASLECGNYTIKATAYHEGYPEITDQITVCVCNIPDLMGFWRFDDGTGSRAANDSSCNRNHGTLFGDPVWITDGIWHALRFNGSGEYIEVANSTSLAMTNKTTIGAWANSSDADEQYILAKGDMVFELRGEGGEVVGQNVSNLSWLPGFCGNLKRAQTFNLAADATLNEVRVYINKTDDWAAGGVKVRICTDNGTQPGTEITNATISAAGVNTVYAWHNTSFDCTLTGGTTYWLVLESDRNNWYDYHWGAGSNSTYPGYYPDGKAWYYNGSSWLTDGPGGVWGVDMTFELIATPVPSTYTDHISMPDPDNFKFLVYYGYLNATDIDWSESGLKMILIDDDNPGEIQKVRNAGVDVYFYIELGISYCNATNKSEWEQSVIDFIDNHSYVDGFVLDDLDSDYWNGSSAYWNNASMCSGCSTDDFNARLTRINTHVHSNATLNQKTIANGVRYYANHNGSDYYMWESFMGGNDGTYYYNDFFNGTSRKGTPWGDDPTVWVNGIKKYEYLNASGVLNSTLAHCYGPANDDNRSIYGYIASRVMGLKGFSYADIGNFATEPLRLAEGLRWDLGTRMNYSIDADAGNLSGRFTNGAVVDWVNQTIASNSATYTTDLISDPLTAHLLNSSSRVTGLDLCLIRGQVDFMHGVLRSSTDITGWDSWHHNATAAVILDALNGTATLYVDDVPAAERTFPNGLPFDFTGSNLTIGANNTGAYGFNGSIEEVLIYDR